MPYQQPKIALVHDDFIQAGGAESLFTTVASLFPNAPIYTSLVNWSKLSPSISRERIKTSFIQKIPFATKFYKLFLPLYPLAFETFDFTAYDLVISSTTRFANAVITKPQTIHICYINSLPRFLWNENIRKDYIPSALRVLIKPLFSWFKRWNQAASHRVDHYIANSQNVKNQIHNYYGLEADVVYPFADLNFFKPTKVHNWQLRSQEYFLVVSRLVKWKKIEIAVRACSELGKNLIIVGEGPDAKRLKEIAVSNPQSVGSKISFLGKASPDQLRELYQNCEALLVTQEEDFGIAAVEAQSCGRPVIAYEKGGQAEIIKMGQTGILFENQTARSLKDAIEAYYKVKWSESACRKNALKFSQSLFIKRLKNLVNSYTAKNN